jgi:hypothetical protein
MFSATLKMDAAGCSETLAGVYQTTQCPIPESSTTEVLTAVTMRSDVTGCSLVDSYQSFGETCCVHLQGYPDGGGCMFCSNLRLPPASCLAFF